MKTKPTIKQAVQDWVKRNKEHCDDPKKLIAKAVEEVLEELEEPYPAFFPGDVIYFLNYRYLLCRDRRSSDDGDPLYRWALVSEEGIIRDHLCTRRNYLSLMEMYSMLYSGGSRFDWEYIGKIQHFRYEACKPVMFRRGQYDEMIKS